VPLSRNLGTLTSWNPLGHFRPVTGMLPPPPNLSYVLFPLKPSSSSSRLLPHHPVPSIFPSITCFIRRQQAVPQQSAFLRFAVRWIFLSSFLLNATLFFIFQTICPTKLLHPPQRYFPRFSKFQHHTKLYAKYKIALTPWSRVLLEKLTGLQLVKIFLAFYETRRFLTALTSARHLSLS
jgi:hypothetical protein